MATVPPLGGYTKEGAPLDEPPLLTVTLMAAINVLSPSVSYTRTAMEWPPSDTLVVNHV